MQLGRGSSRRAGRNRSLLRGRQHTRGDRALHPAHADRARARCLGRRPDRRRDRCVLLPDVGAGRRDPNRRGHDRRRASDSSAPRCAHGADARAAGGLPRSRRGRGIPLGVGVVDLSTLRLRAWGADGRDEAGTRAHRVRAAVRAAWRDPSRGRRGGGANISAALRAAVRTAPRTVRAVECLVGGATPRAEPMGAEDGEAPRPARARRRTRGRTRSTS